MFDNDALNAFMRQAGRHKLLTKDDEARLGAAILAGTEAAKELQTSGLSNSRARKLHRLVADGEAAQEAMILANQRLVFSVVKRYGSSGFPLSDLIQEGNLGLLRAVAKFDPKKGFRFSTYAVTWIQQFVSRAVAESSRPIRLPVHASEMVAGLRRAEAHLVTTLGRIPTTGELAAELDVTPAKLAAIQSYTPAVRSLDVPGDMGRPFGEIVSDPSAEPPDQRAIAESEQRDAVHLLDDCGDLDEGERLILRLRFGIGLDQPQSLAEVAQRFETPRKRLRQVEIRALRKLRAAQSGQGGISA